MSSNFTIGAHRVPDLPEINLPSKQKAPRPKPINLKPEYSVVIQSADKLEGKVFKGMLKSTLGWVPKLLAAPFAALATVKGSVPARVAKIALLSPLAFLATLNIAGALLIGALPIAVAALINAGVAARTGEDLHGKAVLISIKENKIKLELQTPEIIDNKGEVLRHKSGKPMDESGAAKDTDAVYYTDFLKKRKGKA